MIILIISICIFLISFIIIQYNNLKKLSTTQLSQLSTEVINKLSINDINNLTPEKLTIIIPKLSTEVINKLSVEAINKLSVDNINTLIFIPKLYGKAYAMNSMNSKIIILSPDQINTIIPKLSTVQLSQLSKDAINNIPNKTIDSLSLEKFHIIIARLSPYQLSILFSENINKLSIDDINNLTTEQLPIIIPKLSCDQLNKLSTFQLSQLTGDVIKNLPLCQTQSNPNFKCNCPYECNYTHYGGMRYEDGTSNITSITDKYNSTNNIECINYCRNNYEKIYKISQILTKNNVANFEIQIQNNVANSRCENCKKDYDYKYNNQDDDSGDINIVPYIKYKPPISEYCPCINNVTSVPNLTNVPLSECDNCILNYNNGYDHYKNFPNPDQLKHSCPCVTNTSNVIQEIYPIQCDVTSYGS